MRIATFSGPSKSGLCKADIKKTSVLILLSILGNRQCTGKEGILRLIVENAIREHKSASFLIGDEVYWHNLKGACVNELEMQDLKQQAVLLGDTYLRENLPYFLAAIKRIKPEFDLVKFNLENESKSISEQLLAIHQETSLLGIPIEIIRWREWVANKVPDYVQHQSHILALYESEPLLKSGHESSVNEFVRRRNKRNNRQPQTDQTAISVFKKQSEDYLREESPAILLIGAMLGFEFVAYPGKTLKIHEATKTFFINNNQLNERTPIHTLFDSPEKKVNWLEIETSLEKKPQTIPLRRIKSCDTVLNGKIKMDARGGEYYYPPTSFFQPIQSHKATKTPRIETPMDSILINFIRRYDKLTEEEKHVFLINCAKVYDINKTQLFAQELLLSLKMVDTRQNSEQDSLIANAASL